MTSDKKDKEEGWYSTGCRFGVMKDRQIEIFEDLKSKMDKGTKIDDVEQYISETYIEAGEAFVAGFCLCFYMTVNRMREEREIRKAFWDFLMGTEEGVIDPFGHAFPIKLIEIVALGRDVTKGTRLSFEEYQKFLDKRKSEPEVA